MGILKYLPKKDSRIYYYTIPLLTIILLSFITNFFYVDKRVINELQLWDLGGRSYSVYLNELNLPHKAGALFISGTLDNIEKTEKYYGLVEGGDIFTSQIRSLLFETKITAISIASYINFIFCISAILFSLLAGYLVFRNGYLSIVIFLLIVIFRNDCQGLIYGLPNKYTYVVFNPLLTFSIFILIITFLKNPRKIYWIIFGASGFAIAYIGHVRTSEKAIIILSLIVLAIITIICIKKLRIRKEILSKTLISISIIFATMFAGYLGYHKMIDGFRHHRDKKFDFPPNKRDIITGHTFFHIHFASLFRYPNKYDYCFQDMTPMKAAFKEYPDLKLKYSTEYFALQNSREYNKAIRNVYINHVLAHPAEVFTYLVKSVYDYSLFLPYFTWTGDKSAHVIMPRIKENIVIDPEDIAPDFRTVPEDWLLNLKIRYLPNSAIFWIYLVFAYALLIQAVYISFFKFRKTDAGITSLEEAIDRNIAIYLLRGMLLYFFFTSIVRILIPMYGHSAVVAFNVLIIFNLTRIIVNLGYIKIKERDISLWSILLVILILLAPILCMTKLWSRRIVLKSANSNLVIVDDGGVVSDYLQIFTTDPPYGYAYYSVPTIVGKVYALSYEFKTGANPVGGSLRVGTFFNEHSIYNSSILKSRDGKGEEWEDRGCTFTAHSRTTYITMANHLTFRNEPISFRKIVLRDVASNKAILRSQFNYSSVMKYLHVLLKEGRWLL